MGCTTDGQVGNNDADTAYKGTARPPAVKRTHIGTLRFMYRCTRPTTGMGMATVKRFFMSAVILGVSLGITATASEVVKKWVALRWIASAI